MALRRDLKAEQTCVSATHLQGDSARSRSGSEACRADRRHTQAAVGLGARILNVSVLLLGSAVSHGSGAANYIEDAAAQRKQVHLALSAAEVAPTCQQGENLDPPGESLAGSSTFQCFRLTCSAAFSESSPANAPVRLWPEGATYRDATPRAPDQGLGGTKNEWWTVGSHSGASRHRRPTYGKQGG